MKNENVKQMQCFGSIIYTYSLYPDPAKNLIWIHKSPESGSGSKLFLNTAWTKYFHNYESGYGSGSRSGSETLNK